MDYLPTTEPISLAKTAAFAAFMLYGLSALRSSNLLPWRRKPSLPPGPPGLPIIGNILDVPPEDFWWKYKEWSDQYDSDIIYLNMLGQDVIILHSLEACKELLERRSSIYSSRPNMPMINDFIGFDWHFAFMPYGDAWKERRKLFTQAFGPNKIEQFRPQLLKHIRNFLFLLLDDPEHFQGHNRLTAGAFILDITYGLEVKSFKDPYITQAEQGMHAMSEAGTAAAYAVDFFPSLRYIPSWFPGIKFKKDAKAWRPYVEGMAREPFKFVEDAIKRGDARPCVATTLLQELDEDDPDFQHQKKVIHDVLAAVYAAGSDTTVSSIATFLLAMAENPDIQKKAQGIVDEVTGALGALPDFTEYGKLPYIDGVVREVFRWRPVTPVGAPHSVIQDDVYKGYHIPKGATILENCYALAHDPALYGPHPERFDPSRYLNAAQSEINPEVPLGLDTFGFGRRICPGLEIAFQTVWMEVMSVLAAFDISVKDGKQKEGFGKFTSGLISLPEPFEINIVPRSKEVEASIRSRGN